MTTVEILKEMAFTATETQRRALEDAISVLSAEGDLISRQAVLEYIASWLEMNSYYHPYSKGESIPTSEIKDIVNSVPSVENKGEWIKIQSGDKDFPESIVCSKCKNENSHLDFNEHGEPIGKVFITSNFCPNCGADMRGE